MRSTSARRSSENSLDGRRRLAQHGLRVLPDLAARDHLAGPRTGLALDLLLAAPRAAVIVVVVVRIVIVRTVIVRMVVIVIVFGSGHRQASY